MQAHAKLSGQVAGQLAVPQQNRNSLPSQGGLCRTWHAEADVGIRRMVAEQILLLFQKRKPQVFQDWQQKLPDLVKRLEESLFWDASSKEEYTDLSTLEHRLSSVAKQIVPPRNNANFGARGINTASSSMIPTPGMPSALNGSTMIPTPGNEISVVPTPGAGVINTNPGGIGNMLPSNGGTALLQGHGVASSANMGNMVPTPGLGPHLFTGVEPAASMPGNSMTTSQGRATSSLGQNVQMSNLGLANAGAVQLQQQQYNSGSSGNMYRNMNGQLGGNMASNIQRKNPASFGFVNASTNNGLQLLGNGPHLVNGNSSFPNSSLYTNSGQFGSMPGQTQQHMNQQRQHMSMQSTLPGQMATVSGDGYTMNAVDVGGPGNFYNPVSTGFSASSLGMHSQGLQGSKMIPVPGLPSQHNMQSQHHQQPQSPALDKFQQINFQQNSAGIARNQQQQYQHQQLPKSQTLYQAQISSKLYGQKQAGMALQQEETQPVPGSVSSLTPVFQSSPDQQQSHHPQHSQTLIHQQQQHVSHPQTAKPGLLQQHQQQMTQQSQSTPQQQIWHHQGQSDQTDQQTGKQYQQHQLLQLPQPQLQHLQQSQQQSPLLQQQNQPEPQLAIQQQQHSQQQLPPQHCTHQQEHQNMQQHPVEDVREQSQELQKQTSQQLQLSQVTIQQPFQVSAQQPQQQGLSLDDSEPQTSHQMAGNGTISAPQAPKGTDAMTLSSATTASADGQRAQQYLKQQRWLLFLRHASKCTAPEGQCQTTLHCHTARQLWGHITKCNDRECQYFRCSASRTLLRHHQQCRDTQCPVCAPVRQKFIQQRMQAVQGQAVQVQSTASLGMPNVASSACRTATLSEITTDVSSNKLGALSSNGLHTQPPSAKRAKIEPTEEMDIQQGLLAGAAKVQTSVTVSAQNQTMASTTSVSKSESHALSVKAEGSGQACSIMKTESHGGLLHVNATAQRVTQVKSEISSQGENEPGVKQTQPLIYVKPEPFSTATQKVSVQVKQEVKQEVATSASPSHGPDPANTAKSIKPKIKGVSLTELFTPEQIREHIVGLRQWVGQSKAKAEKNQAMEHRMSENSCQLCAVETLTFEPPPIYCTPCGARIKRNALYWTMGSGDTRHCFCIPCYNDARSDTVELDGVTYPKSKLERRKNDEETEEPWVQCDKCEKWQHQVCTLFNMRRNEGGQAEYTCPQCLMGDIEKGERKPLPQSAVLGAKDLPRTLLSDHIEQRLARRLKHERLERARAQGKGYDEVPGADALVIRVVSSVDKKLEVKQHFLEIFQEEDYPTEFPYKSKVLLLFQKIEGVEVCLFGMYVQEFGVESAQPNERRVYLSYLDSVKYFRPDIRTANGEALRTFVYHEILIGYLDYCKKRGFTSCYIWACPPLKGEDYILYCHPEIQKTPKSEKLREWYLTMLRKAGSENIVVEVTNLYDHFFVCIGEAKARVTAARLPYFDGDYWPGAAEDMIMQLQEEEDGRRQQKKGKAKKTATKRATKAAAQAELASNASKDLQLMQKLGESIYPMKEDFIMVHLQYACTHCCNFIISGHRWVCKQCKTFHICERCYDVEQKLDERDRHPVNCKEAHQLIRVEIGDNLADTKDKDEIMESEFFDTRQAFLSLCQGNHYQYDTLRRAKHSSMMVLYHLHNPTAPAFVTTCNMCHRDIETGQGWRCETCPDFDLCNLCYSKDDSVKHPHKLSPHPSVAEREAQNKEARQQRVLQLRKMLDLLVHASQCGSAQCQYPNCRRVKGLFRHGMNCKTRASGGCHLCKKMWYLLQLHARACKESECRVPRCKDLKEHLRRLQQQMESRRRAAVMEMMRQRTAEAAAGTG